MKTIRVELAEEAGFRARFAREVAAARRVSGVFTASVIEADADADLPWVATAYVPAPSLTMLVRKTGPLPVPAVRWLAAGCAEALQSIHGAGLLHRDVKPSNVLVAPDGPRVIDFGVARAAERVALTVTRGAAGTPAYMAPEQARDATRASPASDVFSLGATLAFAATGHPPYHGETVMDILVRLAPEPPDLTGLPGELDDLVAPCLERVPRDRPSNAAILSRLGSFTAGQAGSGHAYLPDSAMALIGEYQHTPRLDPGSAITTGEPAGHDDLAFDGTEGSSVAAPGADTAGSHTDLPGFDSIPGFVPPGAGDADQDPPSGRARRRPGRPQRPAALYAGRGGRRASRPLVWAGGAAAAVGLVAAGTAVGLSQRGANAQASGNGNGNHNGGGAPQPSCTAPASGTPQLCVNQPFGDGETVFVIHGSGYAPGTTVTISLAGVGSSRVRPVTDAQGTFNYAIDQGHLFFSGQIPPRAYTAVATARGEPSEQISFTVSPPGAGPPHGPPPAP